MGWLSGMSINFPAFIRRSKAIRSAKIALTARAYNRYLVIHRASITRVLDHDFLMRVFCTPKRPIAPNPDMTIVLIHNRQEKTLAEKSLDVFGLPYVVLRQDPSIPWRNSVKVTALLNWLRAGKCKTKYIFYLDSDDAFLNGDPAKAIEYLNDERCEMLVSNTGFCAYGGMPEVENWAHRTGAQFVSHESVHMNTGIYIARTDFLLELMQAASEFVTDHDVRWNKRTYETLPSFPTACGCDQILLRYLHPRFFPRLMIDYHQRLAIR
jgi:hypothetical protein